MDMNYREFLIKEIQQNFVDDFLNFEDPSVGWYWVGKMNQKIIDEINDDIEGARVLSWSDWALSMEFEGVQFDIEVTEETGRYAIVKII